MSGPIKIMLIGGSSFVAKSFLAYHQKAYEIKLISRSKTNYNDELVYLDFFEINAEVFSGYDYVINCAAVVHQQKKLPDNYYHQINHDLAIDLANKAQSVGVKGFIQLSTIAVYGRTVNINENTPESPVNAYGISKLNADKQLLKMSSDQFKVSIIRPPLIYGGVNAPGNMMRLIKLVNSGLPLPFKNAHHKKDFLNVRNLVLYIEAIIEKNISGIFLLRDQESVSSHNLINTISLKLNKRVVQFSLPLFVIQLIKRIKPDVFEKLYGSLHIDSAMTNQILGVIPKHTLEDGISDMVKSFKN